MARTAGACSAVDSGVPASEDGDEQTDEYPAGERETAGAPR